MARLLSVLVLLILTGLSVMTSPAVTASTMTESDPEREPALVLKPEADSITLAPHLAYYQDKSHLLRLDDLLSGHVPAQFTPNHAPQFMRPGHPLTYWFRFTLRNESGQQRWLLAIPTSRYSQISFYSPDSSGRYQASNAGSSLPFTYRPVDHHHFVFPIDVPSKGDLTYYVRVHIAAEGLLWLPATLQTPEAFARDDGHRSTITAAFYAVMVCMLLYNLFLFLHLRLRPILFYCLTVFFDIAVLGSLDGLNFRYLWPEMPNWEGFSLAYLYLISVTMHLIFVRDILGLPQHLPWANRLYLAAIINNLAGLVLITIVQTHEIALTLIQLDGLLSMLLLIASLTQAVRHRLPSAGYFLVSEVFFISGTIVRLSITLGLIPISAFTYYSFHIGYLFEVILLSLAIADRFRLLQKEKAELQKLALHAAESSNMLKDQFLSTISHELRTPLTGIDSSLHLAVATNPPPITHHYLKAATSATHEMVTLVDKILDFAELHSGSVQVTQTPIHLRALLASLSERFSEICDIKKIRFVLDTGGSTRLPEVVWGDEGKLRAVLNILLDNAVKYTEKGSVRLSVNIDPGRSTPRQPIIIFSIRDTGIGITEKNQLVIFEYFSQADASFSRQHGGLGIGLSMCKALVNLLRGTIVFHSIEGRGSEFSVSLPFGTYQQRPQADQDVHDQSAPHRWQQLTLGPQKSDLSGVRALVVEDNIVNQMIIKALLEKQHIEVETAMNGQHALDRLAEGTYDIVLMDCQMPQMDGFEATRALRAQTGPNQHVPVLAVTANTMAKDVEKCLACGMNDHIKKPIDRRLLIEKIAGLLNIRLSEATLMSLK